MASYFLTGASGYIGGSVAVGLLGAGHIVRGLARSDATAALLLQRGIQPVLGDLDDLELLSREARASDGVINAASADNADAIHALIEGMKGSGQPLLHTSGSSVIGDEARGLRASEVIFDEDTPLVIAPMKQARRQLDQTVLDASAHGVRSMVVCPSLIYGVGRGIHRESVQIPALVADARAHGVVSVIGAGLNIWSNVHIDDLVDLYLLALQDAPGGAFYFAENGECSFADLAAAIAGRMGLERFRALPPEDAARRWGESKAYYTLGSNSRVRARRARQELGWSPRHDSVLAWIQSEMPL